MRVLVTGGAGFIGSNLIEELLKRDHQVVSLDNYSGGTTANHIPGAEYLVGHTSEINFYFPDGGGFDIVYHLGEFARVVPSFDNIFEVWNSNMLGTFSVLQFCVKHKLKLVYSASSTKFAPEGSTHSPYAFSKESNTRLIKGFEKWYGLRYAICYFYNVYGKRDDTGSRGTPTLISNFIQHYKDGKPLPIYGNGNHKRIYTHVSDVVDGLIKSSEHLINDEYFLSTSEAYSVNEVAAMFGTEVVYFDSRPGDRADAVDNSFETRKKLNWEPKVKLKDYVDEFKKTQG